MFHEPEAGDAVNSVESHLPRHYTRIRAGSMLLAVGEYLQSLEIFKRETGLLMILLVLILILDLKGGELKIEQESLHVQHT